MTDPVRNLNSRDVRSLARDAADPYTGLDRFGRVVDQKWVTNGTSVQDEYTYTYDRDGNVLSKSNALNSAFSENYTYDSLSRLTAVSRGTQSTYQSPAPSPPTP